MLDPRFRGDDKCTEHPHVTEALHLRANHPLRCRTRLISFTTGFVGAKWLAAARSVFVKQDSTIEFRCVNEQCKEILSFSILAVDERTAVRCAGCGKEYVFNGELRGKFQKFARLVEAVRDAEDILGQTNVGLDIMGHSVQVPYRILLTRMNTFLTLDIGGAKFNFRLRVEPLKE